MFRSSFLAVVPVALVSVAFAAPPEQALKYHEALLKRPNNDALLERFFGAWLDEQPEDSLEAFLVERAKKNGGLEWAVLSRYQLRRGQEDAALASLGKAIDATPQDASLAMQRGKLRLRRLEFEGARDDFAKVAASRDETASLEAAKLIGKAWLRQGKSEEAIKAWDGVQAAHPTDEDLLEDLVEIVSSEGETKQALVYLDKLIAATKDPYQKTIRSMRKGDLLARAGRNDEAVEVYAATLQTVGEGSWLERELLAQVDKVFRKQDRVGELRKHLAKMAEANPRRLLLQRQLAKLEAAQGEPDAAIGRYREVLKRSPGDRELREEFVRLLLDADRIEDAAVELKRMIELAPADANLWLQLAALRSRQQKPDETLEALKKAREVLGPEPSQGIRIAGLMLQYGLNEAGENLLKELAKSPETGGVAMEALAAHYGRVRRKDEAVELLKKVAATDELDVMLRAAGSISGLGENVIAFDLLKARAEKFANEPRFLAALAQSSLAATKPAEGVAPVIKLVRASKQPSELGESIGLAVRVLAAAGKAVEWRETLEKQKERGIPETCLLAAICESQGDTMAATKLLEASTDPMLIRFHVALLDRRGEFDRAIAILTRLGTTDEGRKAGFFKELSELQQRAGKNAEALVTVERWRLVAPGDKAAWTSASRLLREMGKTEDAVKVARQAAGRFEGDLDLTAGLAALYDESNQTNEAEAIYWRLYDEATSPGDQSRWAGQLAQMALRNGRTLELAEKLQERSRGNRGALGPILAQAELHRVLKNDEKRRDLLMEAVRLQPKDIDLRLQVATLEEQSGNAERALGVLEEALPFDAAGRARAALAQAYIRQGQPLKGVRELRVLAGKQARDPRSIEVSATSLAASKLYDEAITFLRQEAGDGPDWRLSYLLAVLLEENGREEEAVPLFWSLMEAQGELASLPKKPATPNYAGGDQLSIEVQNLSKLISAVTTHHEAGPRGRGNNNPFRIRSVNPPVNGFLLPDDAEEVRLMARIHLCSLAQKMPDGAAIQSKLKAAIPADIDFLFDLVRSQPDPQTGYSRVLNRHLEQPGTIEWLLLNDEVDSSARMKELMKRAPKLPALYRFRAWAQLVLGDSEDKDKVQDEEAWTAMLDAAKEAIADKDGNGEDEVIEYLVEFIHGKHEASSEVKIKQAKVVIGQALDKIRSRPDADVEESGNLQLLAIAITGTSEEWITQFNRTIRDFRKKPAAAKMAAQIPRGDRTYVRRNMGMLAANVGNSVNLIRPLPDGESAKEVMITALPLADAPLASVPYWMPSYWPVEDSNENGETEVNPAALPLAEVMKHIQKIESPVMRAWFFMRTHDAVATDKALAVTPAAEELAEFEMLRGIRADEAGKFLESYEAFRRAAAARATDREFILTMNFAQIAEFEKLKPEERTLRGDEAKALLVQLQRAAGATSGPVIALMASKFGFEEWGKRFLTANPNAAPGTAQAGNGINRNNIQSVLSGSRVTNVTTPLAKLTSFVTARKYDAAAREALNLLRGGSGQSARYYPGGSSVSDKDIVGALGRNGLDELLKLVDPGEGAGLVRRLDCIDICERVGKDDFAHKILGKLFEERPGDPDIVARYLVSAIPQKREAQLKQMTAFIPNADFGKNLTERINMLRLQQRGKQVRDLMDLVGEWLAVADPAVTTGENLSWLHQPAFYFFTGYYDQQNEISLLLPMPPEVKTKADVQRQIVVAKQLAMGMLKHPATSEEGFRLLSASTGWEIRAEELDAAARLALSGRDAEGMDSSDEDPDESLEKNSSVNWLLSRLASGASAEQILPAAFVNELGRSDERLGKLVAAFKNTDSAEKVKVLQDSGLMDKVSGRRQTMVHAALIQRMAAVPGASRLFTQQLDKISPQISRGHLTGFEAKDLALLQTAMNAAAVSSESDRDLFCRAMGRILYGTSMDWKKPDPARVEAAMEVMSRVMAIPSAPAAIMRLMPAFHRAGVPLVLDEMKIENLVQSASLRGYPEMETFLKSAGWLEDAASWTPHQVWVVERNEAGMFVRKSVLADEHLASGLNSIFSGDADELAKRLSKRTEGKFGSLMAAAAFKEDEARSWLVVRALTECAAELQKLPAAKLDEISAILPWVSESAMASLPPPFHDRVKKANEKRLAETRKKVSDYLAKKLPPSDKAFDDVAPLLQEVAPVDVDLAVKVFLEADRLFTASLAKGGQIGAPGKSNYGMPVIRRDQALFELYRDPDSVMVKNLSLGLRFFAKLSTSPEGGRFSLFGVLTKVGYTMYETADGTNIYTREQGLIKMIGECDEDVRTYAAIAAFAKYHSYWGPRLQVGYVDGQIKIANEARATQPIAARFAEISAGLAGLWTCSEPTRVRTFKLLAEVVNDESIPPMARLHFLNLATGSHPDLLNHTELIEPFVKLYAPYCAAERSVINPYSVELLRGMTNVDTTVNAVEPMKRIHKMFWDNADSTRKGGHVPVSTEFAQALYALAAVAGDEAKMDALFEKARDRATGNIIIIDRLIRRRKFDHAMALMPGPGQPLERPNRMALYSNDLEDSLEALRATKPDPAKLLEFEAASLGMTQGEQTLAPKEDFRSRIARIIADYRQHPPADMVARATTLVSISSSSRMPAWDLGEEYINFSKQLPMSAIEADRLAAKPVPGVHVSRTVLSGWQCNIHFNASLMAMGQGDVSLLQELRESFRRSVVPADATDKGVGVYYEGFLKLSAIGISTNVARQETKGFSEAMEVFGQMASDSLEPNAGKRAEFIPDVLAICHFLANWCGEPERFEALMDRLAKQGYSGTFPRRDGLLKFLDLASRDDLWKYPSFTSSREGMIRGILSRPELLGCFPPDASWTERYEKLMRDGEFLAMTLQMPSDWIYELRAPLAVYTGRKLKAQKKPEEALQFFQRAMGECREEEWLSFRNVARLEVVDLLVAQKRKDEAREILQSMRYEDIRKDNRERYRGLSSAVGNK